LSRIAILDPRIAAQIAAGEVITRPAAVVKELVENALDAGARTITVEIAEGGRQRIRVTDDGCGMAPDEAPLSLKRHATSKLKEETDLLNLTTLGFRGEALPSIATVSRLEMITRVPEESAGMRVVTVAGGAPVSSLKAGPVGTQVTVEDLFFNTPARRKFLKRKEMEQGFILEVMRGLALAHPEVHFLLKTPAKILLQAPACHRLSERVGAVYGAEAASRMLPFNLESGPFKVRGLISEPEFSLASSRFQVLLVNDRVVADRLLGGVLKEVYQGLLPRGRHPAAVVSLKVPPDTVDVNVHPAKTEVRFQDAGRLYALLLEGMRRGLGPLKGGEAVRYNVTWHPASLALAQDGGAEASPPPAGPAPGGFPFAPPPPSVASLPAPYPTAAAFPGPGPGARAWRFRDLKILGQLENTYILAQSPEGLVLIDQHAAHERVVYEALKSSEEAIPRQALLFPQVIEVSPAQAGWVKDNLVRLAQAGLELSPFGGASFLLSAAPAGLPEAALEAAVLETVESMAPLKSSGEPQAVQEAARLALACHGAIKAGQELSRPEILSLLMQLDELAVSSHCPHGRPLWRLIPLTEIRQSFRRPRG
jgi:DNA mismatch repair protein MutL